MPSLAASQVSLRDYPSGSNIVVLDVDPEVYNPFDVPIRGSSTKVLNGTVVHQVFGHRIHDFTIELQGNITDYDTVTSLWTKYRQGGSGLQFELRDWYENRFVVIFTPGSDSFHPTPILGACEGHTFTLSLRVLDILEWFGSSY